MAKGPKLSLVKVEDNNGEIIDPFNGKEIYPSEGYMAKLAKEYLAENEEQGQIYVIGHRFNLNPGEDPEKPFTLGVLDVQGNFTYIEDWEKQQKSLGDEGLSG